MPKLNFLLAISLVVTVTARPALAQDTQAAAETFPEVCKAEAGHGGHAGHGGAEPMADSPMTGLNEHQQAAMPGMVRMDRDMMQGMMQEDADVAFICGMIAHHQGAIDMAQVEIEHGDEEEAKALAQRIIDAQTQEIEEMKSWLEKNAH